MNVRMFVVMELLQNLSNAMIIIIKHLMDASNAIMIVLNNVLYAFKEFVRCANKDIN